MTTIVYRDGVLAADTSIWDRGCYVGKTIKIWERSEWLAGGCGPLGECAIFRDWFLGGAEIADLPKFESDDFEAMIFKPDGHHVWFGKSRAPVPVIGKYHAMGSGFRIAMGAMAAGASAERAIEIVSEMDDGTRAPFTFLRHPLE